MAKKTAGQSREALTMEEVYHKKKTCSCGLIVLGLFAVLMTIAAIVLGVLYGLEISSTSSGAGKLPTSHPTRRNRCSFKMLGVCLLRDTCLEDIFTFHAE